MANTYIYHGMVQINGTQIQPSFPSFLKRCKYIAITKVIYLLKCKILHVQDSRVCTWRDCASAAGSGSFLPGRICVCSADVTGYDWRGIDDVRGDVYPVNCFAFDNGGAASI